jgi:uncharacterized protein (DUF302 family)
MRKTALALACTLVAGAAPAESPGVVLYEAEGGFGDVSFLLESAILDRGLVVDHVSHVGEMLARTGEDVGSDVALYEEADVYLFCSAVLSRKVMEADADNIAYCPYGVFVRQLAGAETVEVGYRAFPEGPMQEVQDLLDGIAREAAGVE